MIINSYDILCLCSKNSIDEIERAFGNVDALLSGAKEICNIIDAVINDCGISNISAFIDFDTFDIHFNLFTEEFDAIGDNQVGADVLMEGSTRSFFELLRMAKNVNISIDEVGYIKLEFVFNVTRQISINMEN